MPVAIACAHPECSTLSMGEFCIDHEVIPVAVDLPRGRPVPSWMTRSSALDSAAKETLWIDGDSCSTLEPEHSSQAVY